MCLSSCLTQSILPSCKLQMQLSGQEQSEGNCAATPVITAPIKISNSRIFISVPLTGGLFCFYPERHSTAGAMRSHLRGAALNIRFSSVNGVTLYQMCYGPDWGVCGWPRPQN